MPLVIKPMITNQIEILLKYTICQISENIVTHSNEQRMAFFFLSSTMQTKSTWPCTQGVYVRVCDFLQPVDLTHTTANI